VANSCGFVDIQQCLILACACVTLTFQKVFIAQDWHKMIYNIVFTLWH